MSAIYVAVVKRGFRPVSDDNDEVYPSVLGALKKGLQALQREDAEDDVRAQEKWDQAKALLAEAQEDDTGAGAEGKVTFEDDLHMAEVGIGL